MIFEKLIHAISGEDAAAASAVLVESLTQAEKEFTKRNMHKQWYQIQLSYEFAEFSGIMSI